MRRKSYKRLLAEAPPHDTDAFIDYLRVKNRVEYEDDSWIVIRNYKYWSVANPWLTAFIKKDADIWYAYLNPILDIFGDWRWIKKHKDEQTIKRPHIHLIKHSYVITRKDTQEVPILLEKQAEMASKETNIGAT